MRKKKFSYFQKSSVRASILAFMLPANRRVECQTQRIKLNFDFSDIKKLHGETHNNLRVKRHSQQRINRLQMND